MVKLARCIGVLLILGALIPLSAGALLLRNSRRFLDSAVPAKAVVVEVERRKNSKGETYFYPLFSFEDARGETHRFSSGMGSDPPAYRVGESAAILYDPRDPSRARFDKFTSLWLWPALLLVPGAGLMLAGLAAFLAAPLMAPLDRRLAEPARPPAGGASPTAGASPSNEWLVLCHLSALSVYLGVPFGNIVGPLVVWLMKRGEIPEMDAHGKEAVNFALSMTVYGLVGILLVFVLVGLMLLPALFFAHVAFVAGAAVKASRGEPVKYPLSIRFIS